MRKQETNLHYLIDRNVPRFDLVRRFVETGDERCPIAAVWTRLIETDSAPEESELCLPALRSLFRGGRFTLSLQFGL